MGSKMKLDQKVKLSNFLPQTTIAMSPKGSNSLPDTRDIYFSDKFAVQVKFLNAPQTFLEKCCTQLKYVWLTNMWKGEEKRIPKTGRGREGPRLKTGGTTDGNKQQTDINFSSYPKISIFSKTFLMQLVLRWVGKFLQY